METEASKLAGRITVYSIKGCPHCLASKKRLKDEGLQFVDVGVDRFPAHVRQWLKDKTGKTSVPQIFFNATHIGGNAELQALLDNPEERSAKLALLEAEPGEDAPLLPGPGEAVQEQEEKLNTEELLGSVDPAAATVTALLNASLLGSNYKEGCLRLLSSPVRQSVTGAKLLAWLGQQGEGDPSKTAAHLLSNNFIRQVDPGFEWRGVEGELEWREGGLYTVTGRDGAVEHSLNTEEIAAYVAKPADGLAQDIRKVVLKLFSQFLSDSGKTVDYVGMASSPLWQIFMAMAVQLQRAEVVKLSEDERLAFFINIYNVLVIHGTVKKGVPANTYQRYKFFSGTSYVIGGRAYSLNEMENGILRANRSSMATLYRKPFSKGDPRLEMALPHAEPRIHFALNCGAKSCPPIKTFSGAEVQGQLDVATAAYLENDDALIIDVASSSVKLSQLFQWYREDFGNSDTEVLAWIRDHLGEPEKKEQLTTLMSKGDFKISYITYDWGNNSKEE